MATIDGKTLGNYIKVFREHNQFTQEKVVESVDSLTNRTALALLEQGRRLPTNQDTLRELCLFLGIPEAFWKPYLNQDLPLRVRFEDLLSELVGSHVTLNEQPETVVAAASDLINKLFEENPSQSQVLDFFNSLMVYYGIEPIRKEFFNLYFTPSSFGSIEAFQESIEKYQMDAIRLFPTFSDAFKTLNANGNIKETLLPLRQVNMDVYQNRSEWNHIDQIEEHLLPELGYISAQRVRQESKEREWLISQLEEIAVYVEKKQISKVESINIKTKNKIDTLLRKFDSELEHGVSSPLFTSDPSALKREAKRLAPKTEEQLRVMENTQQRALKNLSNYLAADHMDVYIATSMRTNADYVSVNNFVVKLFSHPSIRPLKLRHFNPTQSWIDDRVAKGLVEALMLKRAKATLYMAQKSDTFGKDSEASVTLGQGKPVVVYVPKLPTDYGIDTEELFASTRAWLIEEYKKITDEYDESIDEEAMIAVILKSKISKLKNGDLVNMIRKCWADFDLYAESERISEKEKETYRNWLDSLIDSERYDKVPKEIRDEIIGLLVASSINFEKRARVFKKVHPLALQVILSTGVLNGILVTRTVEQSALALEQVLRNCLKLKNNSNGENYELIDELTGSTVRVISRNKLLQNAFEAEYKKMFQNS